MSEQLINLLSSKSGSWKWEHKVLCDNRLERMAGGTFKEAYFREKKINYMLEIDILRNYSQKSGCPEG